MANITMRAKDTLSAKKAECYVTIGGNRYNMMTIINLEAKFTKNKTRVPILGKSGDGNKSIGWNGTFTGTKHYNDSIMRRLALEYKNSGEDAYFEIQITNEDPTSSAGRQTITLIDCNLDEMILAKFDANSNEYLSEDFSGTFEDFEMPESFSLLDGMLAS